MMEQLASAQIQAALKAALWFSVVGLVCGLPIGLTAIGEGWGVFPVASTLAAFLTPLPLWWLFVSRPRKPTVWRGAAVGGLSGLLAHPVCWYLLICWNFLFASISMNSGPLEGGSPLDPLEGLFGALVYSLFSIILMGWITMPAGALIGGYLGRRQERSQVPPVQGPLPT